MTLCVCERCGREFPPLAPFTGECWFCAPCWRKAGSTFPKTVATAEEVYAAELATRIERGEPCAS